MPQIVLNAEQASLLTEAHEPVELLDEQGRVLARILSRIDEAALEKYRSQRATKTESYPSADVFARLKKLEEISQRETLDEAKVHQLLDRMRAGEEV